MSDDNKNSGSNTIPIVLICVCSVFALFVISQFRGSGSSSYVYQQPAYTQKSEDVYEERNKTNQTENSNHIPSAAEIENISRRYDGQKQKDMRDALCAVYKTC